MAKLDFHLVSESDQFKVYQAMEAGKMKALEDGSMPAKKYTPYLPKNVAEVDVSADFKGYDVDSIKVSHDGGVVVRVKRDKDDVFVDSEPNVTRLESKGGAAK